MNERDPKTHIKSKIPVNEHKHQGWFYHYPSKLFYRWNDLPGHKEGIRNGNS